MFSLLSEALFYFCVLEQQLNNKMLKTAWKRLRIQPVSASNQGELHSYSLFLRIITLKPLTPHLLLGLQLLQSSLQLCILLLSSQQPQRRSLAHFHAEGLLI